MNFSKLMIEAKLQKKSRIVLALDLNPSSNQILEKSLEILKLVHPYICALKINRHLILSLGLFQDIQKIVDEAREFELPLIMDCKINDIGNTNRVIAERYFRAGFDAVTANPFVGWEEGLEPVFKIAKNRSKGVILLVYMSHRASWEGYGQKVYLEKTKEIKEQYIMFAEKAGEWGADGVVVGATYPDRIKEVHSILKNNISIYSPGVGVQGGSARTAVEAGSEYLIVGRSIVKAKNPGLVAKKLRNESLI